MPIGKYAHVPDFPSDVPIANVPTISLHGLEQNESSESEKLFQACREYGFFCLDLSDSEQGAALLQNVETMLDLTLETLDLEKSILEQFAFQPPKKLDGYKAAGKIKTDEGKMDAAEYFMFNRDDIFDAAEGQFPVTISSKKQDCQNFCLNAHEVQCAILKSLDKSLGIPDGTLARMSPLDKPSATGLRMWRSCPSAMMEDQSVTLGAHTDIGTITLLFNNLVGGLQILPAGAENKEENWQYLRPQRNCAIVNLGDTLVEWTGGLFRSSLHRVHHAPGKHARMIRQSLAYLIRPAHCTTMHRLTASPLVAASKNVEEEQKMSVDDWAAWRAQQIMNGTLKPETHGGVPLPA